MPNNTKAKITVEVPIYLKQWVEQHDLGQNALVTMGLRLLYQQEQHNSGEYLIQLIIKELQKQRLPF